MSDEVFQRTRSGKVGKFKFYKEPLIWVEGDDDVVFFGKMLRTSCRLEPANGRDECEFLVKELVEHNWPYGVIIDGDYDACDPKPEPHERVIRLLRYAIENYLFEQSVIKEFCQNYATHPDDVRSFDENFTKCVTAITEALTPLVILDALNQAFRTGAKTFPDSSNEFLSPTMAFHDARILHYSTIGTAAIAGKDIDALKAKAETTIKTKGLHTLLRGHFALGVIRTLIQHTLKHAGADCFVDNRGMLIMLSHNVWTTPPTAEHVALKERLLELVAKVAAALEAFKTPIPLNLAQG